MMCYVGVDLHDSNNVVVVIDDTDRVLYQKRLCNDLPPIGDALEHYRATVHWIAVESTYKIGIGSSMGS